MNQFTITFDIDWAPDFIIDEVASILRAKRVRSTWFVTHQSAAIDRLREDPDLFELGIHPNFLPGSTHGNTPMEVLEHLISIVPDPISIRTHALIQSSHLFEIFICQTGLKVDSTSFLPNMPHIQPVEYHRSGKTMLRVPTFWGDAYEMEKPDSGWDLTPLLRVKGLKVMGFHPIHVYLNLTDLTPYQLIKQQAPQLTQLTKDVADQYIQGGKGPKTFFRDLVDYLAGLGESLRLRDVLELWNQERTSCM